MILRDIEKLIEEVAEARGLTVHEIKSNGRTRNITSARRAIALIVYDKYSMKSCSHNNATSWGDIAKTLNTARSSLYQASRQWGKAEGAEGGETEDRFREKGYLMPKSEESIHEMARRVCKRNLESTPQGRRKELGYWKSSNK